MIAIVEITSAQMVVVPDNAYVLNNSTNYDIAENIQSTPLHLLN